MSFCEEQKNEIIASQYKSLCCRRALLSGVLAGKGVTDGTLVSVRVTDKSVIDFIVTLIKEIYSKDASRLSPHEGGRGKIISFDSPSASKYLSQIKNNRSTPFTPKCAYCRSAFLRGLFLISGRVSNPEKQYSLEFSLGDALDEIRDFLVGLDLSFKTATRGDSTVLYTKNSTVIEDFFGLAGMNTTAFSVMNLKIKSELRGEANRIANCETNNINKAVNTAVRQISVISALEDAGLLGAFPDELAHTARLRLEYDSLSLTQLASKFTPSISKSGLSHRLAKIEELGKELLKKL